MIPWSYTGPNLPITCPGAQTSLDKYYFKIRVSGDYVYHGPLYLYPDGSYRSNNSREANIMYQKGLMNIKPQMYPKSWNAPFRTLPVVEAPYSLTTRSEPVDKFYRLIILQPLCPPPSHIVSHRQDNYGHVLYFRWDNSYGTGQYVSGGTTTSLGIIESISENDWLKDQTGPRHQPSYNLAYIKLVKQRNLYKAVYTLLKKRNKRIQLKALCKSATKWAIRNLNTVFANDLKTGRVSSIISSISIFGQGAKNIRFRISGFL